MKHTLFILPVLLLVLACSPAWADAADDLIALSHDYEHAFVLDLAEAVPQEIVLKSREMELTNRLLSDETAREKLTQDLTKLDAGLLDRLSTRVAFEVEHDGRSELKSFLDTLKSLKRIDGTILRLKKKIANIYGREVNLMDGEWKHAPDGRRFWTSNEYPDIVLTAAEYRRYSATATVVEEP